MRKSEIRFIVIWLFVFLLTGCGVSKEAETVSSEGSTGSAISQENSQSGRVEAGETVKVVSKQTGKASEVYVEIGSEVEKGQPLLQLDARDLAAAVDGAGANLKNARIAYETAWDNEERARVLKDNGAIGVADYENNYLNVMERAKAAVDLAQATLDKAEIAYEDSTVTAPISGIISEVNVKAGELVSAQSTSVVIINLDEMEVKIYVDEQKINSLAVGQRYKVEIAAIPDRSFEGEITGISGAMDTSSKGYLVNIAVENPEHLIKDGMFAKVNL